MSGTILIRITAGHNNRGFRMESARELGATMATCHMMPGESASESCMDQLRVYAPHFWPEISDLGHQGHEP